MTIELRSAKFSSLRAVSVGVLMTFSALAMSGCGGGGGAKNSSAQTASAVQPTPSPTPTPNPTPSPTPSPTTNQKPTISGAAPAAVNASSAYDFKPSASDADGDALTFSIQNKPSWASFSAASGRLSGTPGAADVGTYSNIAISVSDGKASSATGAFSITVTAMSNGSITLSWSAPTENTDGSTLTDLSGFKIRYGTSPSTLNQTISITNSSVTVYVVENLAPATWYFAITAVSGAGNESDKSSVASKQI